MSAEPKLGRICIVAESYFPNIDGAAVFARLLAEQYVAHAGKVTLITRANLLNQKRVEEQAGVPIVRIGLDDRFGFVARYLAMLSLCYSLFKYRREFDLVLVTGLRIFGAPAVLMCKLLGKRCILRADSCGELSGEYAADALSKAHVKRILSTAYFSVRNSILRRGTKYVAISKDMVSEFINEGVPSQNIVLIPNGVDTREFAPINNSSKSQARVQLGIPANDLVFSFSGRLTREKGLMMMIRAWQVLTRHHKNIHLMLIGTGQGMALSCEEELRQYVEANSLSGSVTFVGPVHDVANYLRVSDIFLFPSRTEALGLALIEAQSCGIPAVASKVGGIPDVIEDNVNGMLFESDDEKEFLQKIEKLLTDPDLRERMGVAGRDVVLNRFSIESVVASYVDLFGLNSNAATNSQGIGR